MDIDTKIALTETVKSVARGVFFAILGVIAVALGVIATSGTIADHNVSLNGLTINVTYIVVAVAGFLAKLVDKYIHENDNIVRNGIAPRFLQK